MYHSSYIAISMTLKPETGREFRKKNYRIKRIEKIIWNYRRYLRH